MVFQSAAVCFVLSTLERGWHTVQRSWTSVAPSNAVVDAGTAVVLEAPEEQAVVSKITANNTKSVVTNRFLIFSPWIVSGFNSSNYKRNFQLLMKR
jgi:hypothetical protein